MVLIMFYLCLSGFFCVLVISVIKHSKFLWIIVFVSVFISLLIVSLSACFFDQEMNFLKSTLSHKSRSTLWRRAKAQVIHTEP
jgi:hypothetical protein